MVAAGDLPNELRSGSEVEPVGPLRVLSMLDKALALQAPLTERHVARLRRNRPEATPHQIVRRLNAELRAATISAGAGVGATAAAPGVGTGVALALSGTEAVAFLNATVLYVLARGEVQGITTEDIERRRTLVMAVMLGDAGAKGIGKVAERTGQHWARQVVKGIPQAKINAVNKLLGRYFVTKYGTKKGIVVLSRVLPFGIGAAIGGSANAVFSQGIIVAANRAFGAPSNSWGAADHVAVHQDGSDERAEISTTSATVLPEGTIASGFLGRPVPGDA